MQEHSSSSDTSNEPPSPERTSYRITDPQTGSHRYLTATVVTAPEDSPEFITEHPPGAVNAIKTADDLTGTLIRIECYNPSADTDKTTPFAHFQQGMAATVNCFNYTHIEEGPGAHSFEWLAFNTSARDARQFIRWGAYYLFTLWWAEDTGHTVENILADGSVVLTDDEVVSVPFTLADIALDSHHSTGEETG